MKIRTDFVTNSSSSSFIVRKDGLTANQVKLIENFCILAKHSGLKYPECAGDWTLEEYDTHYEFDTCMDNFDLHAYMLKCGITEENTNREDEGWDEDSGAEVTLEECIKYLEDLRDSEDDDD